MIKENNIVDDFLKKLQEWGWNRLEGIQTGRDKTEGAIYESELFKQIRKINPSLNDSYIMKGIEDLLNNKDGKEAFNHLRNGLKINIQGESKQVNFIDFNNPQQNKFSYFPWLNIRSRHGKLLEPDLILLINYLPVVVFEFKDQTRAGRNWKEEAFQQIKNYETELQPLFLLNAFNVLSNGYDFLIGTTDSEIFHYTPWKFEENNLFAPEIILDIIQSYIVFSQNQEKKKKIARYHQYDCVKETLKKVIGSPSLKGGINNHTTGSGKSDTMAFLANQLRRKYPYCSIIVITDRNELDRQIYTRFCEYEGTFFTSGDLIIVEEISKLRNQLAKPNQGKIIFVLIQKFRDLADLTEFNNPEGVFVFIDEAHRSQSITADDENKKSWAWVMRQVFPQAFFLGFTATPIEGKTEKEIGPIVHTYSVNQALENEIVVPITYEKAYEYLPRLYWDEEEFAKHFPEKEETFFDKRKNTKNKKDILFESDERTAAMGEFFKKDYENFSRIHYVKSPPKVMYMAYNVNAAHKFFKELQNAPNYQNKSCLVVSKQGRNHSSELTSAIGKEKENINKFKDPKSDLNIVIVVDKLTTGFNMENLERIYLDQQIDASHSFFQKISRVNRKYSDKDKGFVVDLVGNEKTYQKVLTEYFSDRDGEKYINSGKIENLWNFFADFHPQEKLYQLLFNYQQINQKSFFDEALNYCLRKNEKNEEEGIKFFSETKLLRLTLGSQWYIKDNENNDKQKNLDFVNWCFRLGCYFTFNPSKETKEDDEKTHTVEAQKVEGASGEVIKIGKIDFNSFDFSRIKKEIMSIDSEKYPDAYRWVLKSRIKSNLDRRQKWWFSVKEWEDKFLQLLEEYNKKKINSHDLNSELKELDEELQKENQKTSHILEKDAHYPLRKKLMEKLPIDKRENESFVNELIEYFLKLNKDIPDWILREEEIKKARKEIDEKNKKYFSKKMLQEERKELISLLENYFRSEYYTEIKN